MKRGFLRRRFALVTTSHWDYAFRWTLGSAKHYSFLLMDQLRYWMCCPHPSHALMPLFSCTVQASVSFATCALIRPHAPLFCSCAVHTFLSFFSCAMRCAYLRFSCRHLRLCNFPLTLFSIHALCIVSFVVSQSLARSHTSIFFRSSAVHIFCSTVLPGD